MKKVLLPMLVALAFFVSCSSEPSGLADTGSVSLSVDFAGISGAPVRQLAASGKAEITAARVMMAKGSISVSKSVALTNGTGSVQIDELQVGNWSAQVDALDAAGNVIYTGTGTVKVTKNTVTGVGITVSQVTGSVAISVQSAPELLFWSTLGSYAETAYPNVGPLGYVSNASFDTGMFGGSYEATNSADFGIIYSNVILAAGEGCIEFWALLDNPPAAFSSPPSRPMFFMIQVGPTYYYTLMLNANDGMGGGGLSAVAYTGNAATGTFGSGYTYAAILGASTYTNWHHYAMSWDQNGVPGTGGKKLQVWLDGVPYATTNINAFTTLPGTTNGILKLVDNANVQGSVLLDNFKIWDKAKTNFADRFAE